jgi:integrase
MGLRSGTPRLESRVERLELPPRVWPHWWRYARGRHLGYLPSRAGNGTWQARFAERDGRTRYRQCTIGYADDYSSANGHTVLSFEQAWEKAKRWVAEHGKNAIRSDFSASPERLIYCPVGDIYTVGHAVVDYLRYVMMYRRAPQVPMYRANRYILPHLGTIAAGEITSEQIREWLDLVAKTPARRGTGRPIVNPTEEDRQRRRHTANAALSTLSAALNLAFHDGKISTDVAWRRVRKYRDLQKGRIRYLTEEEARRLLAVVSPDFADLILGALYTGCRVGELISMQVRAYDPKTQRLYVAPAKSNWARWLALPDEAVVFFGERQRDRAPDEPMFARADGDRWKISAVQALMVRARRAAGLGPDVVFHTLRHSYASHLVMAGASLLAVMKLLGHADIRLVVKCYAHLSPDFLADTVRLHFPKFSARRAVAREWREVESTLASPTSNLIGLDTKDSGSLNPAAEAARRWRERSGVPNARSYQYLAGKM